MDAQLKAMVNDGLRRAALLGGNSLYDVLRPNYSDPLTVTQTIATGVPVRADRNGGGAGAEPFYAGVQYLTVGCDRTVGIDVGDILVPNPRNNVSVPDITIQNFDDGKDTVAFRSYRKGKLTKSVNETLFDNVRFEVFSVPGPEKPIDPDMDGSMPFEAMHAVLWRRPGIVRGHRLIDAATQEVWDIQAVAGTGCVMILVLRAGRR